MLTLSTPVVTTRRLALAALGACLAAAAPAAAQGTPTMPPAGAASGAADAGMMAPPAIPPGVPVLREPAAAMFTDAKIAATASVSNQSEILPSQYALQRTQRADVRQFAQRMVAEHTQLEQQMQQMLRQKGVTPEHNAYSYQMQQNLGPMLRELGAASARDFDRLYMSHQVASHMSTLHALDTSLIPNTKDPQMKAMLRDVVRPAVAGHYVQAIALRDAVAQGGNTAAGMR